MKSMQSNLKNKQVLSVKEVLPTGSHEKCNRNLRVDKVNLRFAQKALSDTNKDLNTLNVHTTMFWDLVASHTRPSPLPHHPVKGKMPQTHKNISP